MGTELVVGQLARFIVERLGAEELDVLADRLIVLQFLRGC
jgi:hypothetical protein